MTLPKPASIHALEGNPNKRAIKATPQPDGTPQRPQGLGKHGRKLWDKLVPQLSALGIAKSIDETTLEGLCFWWDTYKCAALSLDKYEDRSDPEAVKCFNVVLRAWEQYSRLARLFGLSAFARSSISVAPNEENEADDYLKG